MAAPLAALLSGPVLRILAVVALIALVFVADFGGLVDTIWFEIEQLLQVLLSPF